MDEVHERLVRHIKELAGARKMPLSHIPDRAGVGRTHFWAVLSGKSTPTLAWMVKVSAALEVEPAELLR